MAWLVVIRLYHVACHARRPQPRARGHAWPRARRTAQRCTELGRPPGQRLQAVGIQPIDRIGHFLCRSPTRDSCEPDHGQATCTVSEHECWVSGCRMLECIVVSYMSGAVVYCSAQLPGGGSIGDTTSLQRCANSEVRCWSHAVALEPRSPRPHTAVPNMLRYVFEIDRAWRFASDAAALRPRGSVSCPLSQL